MTCEEDKKYFLTNIDELTDASLIDYLLEFGVPASTSRKYLQQVKLYNREDRKHFLTVGMINEDEGYELRSSELSDYIDGERDVSFVRGLQLVPPHLHVFLDMMDFLLVVSRQPGEAFVGDAIVLHSLDLLNKVPPYVYQYDYDVLFSWMPNTHKGMSARIRLSAVCATEPRLRHRPQNPLYADCKTVNAGFYRQPGPIRFF